MKEIFDPRPEKIIFVKGSPDVKYADVIFAMDVARGSGVKVIGIPPKDTPGAAAAPAKKSVAFVSTNHPSERTALEGDFVLQACLRRGRLSPRVMTA